MIVPFEISKAVGLLIAIVGISCPASTSAQSVAQYNYDALGRLTGAQDGVGSSSSYQLDTAGNRKQASMVVQFPQSWPATSAAIGHKIGRADDGGWSASVYDSVDHMVYGPYTTGVPAGSHVAAYRMLVDNNSADNGGVVDLDVWDSTAGVQLALRHVTRMEWAAPSRYQVFELPFQIAANAVGHAIEFRIYYLKISYVRAYVVGYR